MIAFDNIHIAYDGKPVVSGLSLDISEGEFFTLLGPSGCGKTTLLRTISGFVAPQSGRVLIGNQDVTSLAPEQRGVGIVFQNYALFPHLSVFENVAFGLRVARRKSAEVRQAVEDALERIGVAEHAHKKPDALSGGQQQRVAIARALVVGARVLLLDEPLSNLDAKMRGGMRAEIRDLQQRLGLTAVYVTHDQEEALAISDRIGIMNAGHIDQVGTPRDIYHRPETDFVCTFVGETVRLSPEILAATGADDLAQKAAQHALYARPEDFIVDGASGADVVTINGRIRSSVFRGARLRLTLAVGEQALECDVDGRFAERAPDSEITISIARDTLYTFARGEAQ